MVFSDASTPRSGSSKHRDEALAAKDRRTWQAWAEIAQAVRRDVNLPPVGGLHRSRLKIGVPKASGRRPRGAFLILSKRYSAKTILRAWPGRSAASPTGGGTRELAPPVIRLDQLPMRRQVLQRFPRRLGHLGEALSGDRASS